MSHNLATVNGEAALVYAQEGGTPWHRLGKGRSRYDSYEDWKRDVAGFDFAEVPLTFEYDGKSYTAPNHKGILRPDTGFLISIMSKNYRLLQPTRILDFYRDNILVDPRFTLEAAGLLNGGRKFWCVARFCEEITVQGERHICYVMFTTSFDGTLATTAQAVLVRAICENTWNMAQSGAATVRIPHNVNFEDPKVQSDIIARLSDVASGFDKYKAMADALHGVKMSGDEVENLFKALTIERVALKAAGNDKAAADKKMAEPSTRARNQLAALLESYRETLMEGTTKNTGWAVLNAVTRYVDHSKTARSVTGDGPNQARMASAFYGSGAQMKRDVLNVLADKAGDEFKQLIAA